ncbi:RCC1 domain-containing protein 1 [Papilio machaon]|uniref:RCC1 domain-containing protein 1 n=1 Tax=Papilio machaon TaxID=76193 RepID=A0A194QUN2_PAPMA|nr:RCC1 domain-containing protein 1 [Papilio machaon]
MSTRYKFSGNNLFGQWFLNEPILEKFQLVSKNHGLDFKLMHMSWSHNVFQSKNAIYVSGAWDNNENVVKRLDLFFGVELKATDLLAAGNDDFFYVVDVKRLTIWIMHHEFDKTFTFYPLDLKFTLGKMEKENNDIEIVKMIVSNKSVYFLTNKGCIFTGIPPIYLDTRHCLGRVCDVACGYEHCILLTDFGHVYTWGSGKRFQLGHGDIEDIDKPQEVDALAGIKITKIAAGGYHCLALSEFGDAYTWGWNDEGQLGILDNVEHPSIENPIQYSIPKLIDIYDENGEIVTIDIVDIACGSKHSALKLADNTVWTSGYNKYGQLGLSSKMFPSVKYFRKVYESCINFKIMCGIWCTVIETTSN